MDSKDNGVFLITALSSGHKKQKLSDEHDIIEIHGFHAD